MSNDEKTAYGLLYTPKGDTALYAEAYYNPTAMVVRIDPDDHKPRNPSADSYSPEMPYADLVISAQMEARHAKDEEHIARYGLLHSYAWRVEFRQPWSVELDRARAMVKTLARVGASLARMRDRRGESRDFADFLGRAAEALGIECMIFQLTESRTEWSYTAGEYDALSIGAGVERVRHDMRRWASAVREAAGLEKSA